jgi:hypothetical protein
MFQQLRHYAWHRPLGDQMTERPTVISVETLWKPADLAAFLGIPEKTLREWRYKRYGPPYKRLGKHVRYDPAAVRAWLDDTGTEVA